MKIAIDVSQVIYGTGVSVYTRELLINLNRLVKSTKIVAFGGSLRRKGEIDILLKRLPKIKNHTFYLPPFVLDLLWNNLHVTKAEWLTGPVDLIHTSDWAEPPSRLPKVTTIHDLSFFKDPDYTHPKVRQVHKKRLYWVAREAAKIIAVSHATKEDIVKYLEVDPSRIEVIHEAGSLKMPSPLSPQNLASFASRLHLKKPYFLVPGSGHPRKNIPRLVKAFSQYSKDFQLIIIGRPSPEELKYQSEDVVFTGFVSDSDLAYLYKFAELLLYPSLYEGFGIPVLEAFSLGLPVVTSCISSLPEVAGDAAIQVDPEDPEAIAAGIMQALDQKESLVELGRARLSKFTWRRTAAKTLRLYKQIIKEHR